MGNSVSFRILTYSSNAPYRWSVPQIAEPLCVSVLYLLGACWSQSRLLGLAYAPPRKVAQSPKLKNRTYPIPAEIHFTTRFTSKMQHVLFALRKEKRMDNNWLYGRLVCNCQAMLE